MFIKMDKEQFLEIDSTEYNSFTEGINHCNEFTDQMLEEVMNDFTIMHNIMISSLTEDVDFDEVKAKTKDMAVKTKDTVDKIVKWNIKYGKWVSSFVMESEKWAVKNRPTFLKNEERLNGQSITINKTDYGSIDGVIDKALDGFKKVDANARNILKDNAIGEISTVESILGSKKKEFLTKVSIPETKHVSVDELINNISHAKKSLMEIYKVKASISSLKNKVSSMDSVVKTNGTTLDQSRVSAFSKYFRQSSGGLLSSLSVCIKALNTILKQSLSQLRKLL